jgi:hypothetical protein
VRRRGQVLPGNPGGPGRPKAAAEAKYFTALRSDCDLETFGKVVKAVVEKALKGDVAAARLLFDRLLPVSRLEDLGAAAGRVNVLVLSGREVEGRREALRQAIVR